MDIDVQSYRQVWHHKERADHLCWIFSLSATDMVRIVEQPGSVEFIYRPTSISQSLVDSGKPFKLAGASTLFAVINPNARISVTASWSLEGPNPF